MNAHLDDLRAEVAHLSGKEGEAWLSRMTHDWRQAGLDEVDAALCAYAEKLTHTPAAMNEGDIRALRERGLDDGAIHDAIQVIAYFNYINRVADAVHVDLEQGMDPYPHDSEVERHGS